MEKYILLFGLGIVASVILLLMILYFFRKKQVPGEQDYSCMPPDTHESSLAQNDILLSPPIRPQPQDDSIHLQLEILRQALELTTAILLCSRRDASDLQLLNHATCLNDDEIRRDSFSRNAAIFAQLREDHPRIAIVPVSPDFVIPYYTTTRKTGSFLAQYIPVVADQATTCDKERINGMVILCIDREKGSPWTESELKIINLTCRKLAKDLHLTNKLKETNRQMKPVHQICTGLLELNQVLDLQGVFEATIKTVKQQTSADFIAISLLEDGEHRIAIANGPKSKQFEGLTFPADDGMVGQAIKLRKWLPSDENLQDNFPVFSNEMRMAGLESLLILPLLKGDLEAIGALTAAGRKPKMFPAETREILEVIASQVATKIELARAHEKICQMATTDGLTGLGNHQTFQHAFDNMLNRAQRHSAALTVVLADLDHFKKINDTFGHPFGDAVLRKIGGLFAATTRKVDLAARYGGEEFALLLEDSDSKGALKQIERVRAAIHDLAFHHNDSPITISMSFGLASFPQDGESKDDLIKKADEALYHAKSKGRNCCISWADIQHNT